MKPKFNKDILPVLGIVAFSACSVNAVANLFFDKAQHDTWLFWLAAILVELCTSWLVWSVVETTRKVTKSNISKQDRRFHSIILTVFLVLAIPSLGVSVVANIIEFGGNVLLGLLFPTLSVACAVGAGLPQTVKRYESQKETEAKEAQRKRKQREREKAKEQEQRQKLARLGKAANTLMLLAANPTQTQASIAQELGVSRQAVGFHLAKLEEAGAIAKDNGQVKILWDVVL